MLKMDEGYFGKDSSKGAFNEDFVIIENPEFSREQRIDSLHNLPSQPVNGVENEFLPPPRTLDDAPLRRRKAKPKPYQRKGSKKYTKGGSSIPESSPSLKFSSDEIILVEEPDTSSQISSLIQSTNEFGADQLHASQTQQNIDDKNVIELLKGDEDNIEDHRQSTAYNLRKKSVHVDYSSHFILLENEDELESGSFTCSECHFSFAHKEDLKHHQLALHDSKSHSCEECGKDFTTAAGLQRHIFSKHGQSKCPLCDKRFQLEQTLIRHMKFCGEHLATDNEDRKPKSKSYPCPHCDKKFSERGNLRRHIKLHQGIRDFCCGICGKTTTEKQALESHIRYVHSGERPYHCDKCTKSFATKSDLNRHQAVHTNIRKYPCSDCGKSFKNREALKAHLRLKSSEKLWQCGVCCQRFISKWGLKTHMVTHTKLKMFECETCQRKFSHKASLEAHIRVHTGLMPYVCPVCGKKFAHLQNRNRHVKTMHLEDS